MAIHYSIEERGRYLYLSGEGTEEGLDENKQIHEMIVTICKSRNCPRVLIDDRNVIYTASIFSIYELAKHYAEVDIPRFIQKAAVVVNPKYQKSNKFFEDTVRNRGINLRVFHKLEEAETWLSES